MTSSPHGLYDQGYTRTTMVGTKGSDRATCSESLKAGLSPDWSLQLDSMKLESLVIVDQHATVIRSRALYTPPVTPRELVVPEAVERTIRRRRLPRYDW